MASLRGTIAGFRGVLYDKAAAEELALVSMSGGRFEEENGGIYTLVALAVKNVWSIWKLRSCIWDIMTEGVYTPDKVRAAPNAAPVKTCLSTVDISTVFGERWNSAY
jgi:hypothetical protein